MTSKTEKMETRLYFEVTKLNSIRVTKFGAIHFST